MACPLFVPDSPLAGSPAASPLGAIFRGSCDAHCPDEKLLLHGCNTGYARGICPHAAALEADAIRFRIRSHAEGVIEVAWSSERDHHPVAVGVLKLEEKTKPTAALESQARAAAAVYLRSRGINW